MNIRQVTMGLGLAALLAGCPAPPEEKNYVSAPFSEAIVDTRECESEYQACLYKPQSERCLYLTPDEAESINCQPVPSYICEQQKQDCLSGF